MKTITVKNFHAGITNDIYSGNIGEFAIAKQFDTLTYPNRLQPLRGMANDTGSTAIGNIIVASDGLMYGIGDNGSSASKLWQRSGYGASDVWQAIPTTSQVGGAVPKYNLLVEYVEVGTTPATDRTMFWAETGNIRRGNKLGASSSTNDALTFTNIGQGLVHPKDKILYIPYDNKIATYALSTTLNSAQFTLPAEYVIPCLSYFGNYLAIPGYSSASNRGSVVYLSDRDTSVTTFAESINWGAGQLRVLNNLEGVLIGISTNSSNTNGSVQDSDSVYIKGYSGGGEPFVIKEIKAQHLTSSGQPSVSINQNVNFVYKNRLYFSVNIVPNDGVSNSYYGLWSVGRNKITGQYSVTMERVATNSNTETGVLAAAISGDFVSMAHTAVGTLTCTINGQTSATSYGATSIYESVINPGMEGADRILDKQLDTFSIHCQPLTTGQQIIAKYRVDSIGSWTTIFTKTPSSPDTKLTVCESSTAGGTQFTSGRNYEFRLESTGGAVITGFSYKYHTNQSQLN